MTPIKLNVNSWHYKLADWGGYDPDRKDRDVCAYTRRVIWGAILSTVVTIIMTSLAIALLSAVANMIVVPISYFFFAKMYGDIAGAIICWLAFLIVGFIHCVRYWLKSEKRKQSKCQNIDKPDGFMKVAYNSWKGKYCSRLEFVDKNGNKYETYWDIEERERMEREAVYEAAYSKGLAASSSSQNTTGSTP